jgi:hypothetical protein
MRHGRPAVEGEKIPPLGAAAAGRELGFAPSWFRGDHCPSKRSAPSSAIPRERALFRKNSAAQSTRCRFPNVYDVNVMPISATPYLGL